MNSIVIKKVVEVIEKIVSTDPPKAYKLVTSKIIFDETDHQSLFPLKGKNMSIKV